MANLMDFLSSKEPQQQLDSRSLQQLANANQSTAPGLALFQTDQAVKAGQQEQQTAAAAKQKLVTDMAGALRNKDYQGALSLYSQLDPEGVKSLLPQIGKIDPAIAESLGYSEQKGQTEGQLESQTKYGSNPKQLKEMEIEEAKTKAAASGIEDDRKFRRIERFQNDVFKVQDKLSESTALLDTAYSQAELAVKNDAAALNLGRSIIKAVEGPGSRVSNEDFKTAVGSASLGDQLYNKLQGWKEGTLRPKTQKEIIEMLDAAKQVQEYKFNKLLETRIKQGAKRFNLDEDEARELALPGSRTSAPAQTAPTQPQSPVTIQGTSIKAPVGAQVRSKSTGKIMTVQSDGSLK